MRTINEVGMEILSGNPKGFYVFLGPEYGIKCKYIDSLKQHYGDLKEYPSVNSLLKMFNTRRLIPLSPCVYVVRYDEDFLSSLSEKTKSTIHKTNFIGTVVCIYEGDKAATKISKYIGDYAVQVDPVNPDFIEKYLHQEFVGLADRFVKLATKIASDYGQARNICRAIKASDQNELYRMSDNDIAALFGHEDEATEQNIRKGIAARNFGYLMKELPNIDDLNNVFYTILQTMIELDKLKDSKFAQSDIREFANKWIRPDIYHMFNQTYQLLKKSRSASFDLEDSIVYLFSLLAFKNIPAVEELS